MPGQLAKPLYVLLATVILTAVGLATSFFLDDAGRAVRILSALVFWPVQLVLLIFSDSKMPDPLLNLLAFTVEYAYVWAFFAVGARAGWPRTARA